MLYSGHDIASTEEMDANAVGIGKQMGLAASWDGLQWERCGEGPVFEDGVKSDNPFVMDTVDGKAVFFRKGTRSDGRGGKLQVVRWKGWPDFEEAGADGADAGE